MQDRIIEQSGEVSSAALGLAAVFEVLNGMAQLYFTTARIAGLTPEQARQNFLSSYTQLLADDPDLLPDVVVPEE